MEFGERLAAARKDKKLSQEALAEALGVSRQAVSKWETGESRPDLDNLLALCRALELRMEYLCFGTVEKPARPEVRKGISGRLAALIGAACLTLGLLLGLLLPQGAGDTRINPASQLEQLVISDVRAAYDHNQRCYRVDVMPSIAPEGMEVILYAENLNFPSLGTETLECEPGMYYVGYLKNSIEGTSYRIIAEFRLGEEVKRFPLLNLHPSKNGISFGKEMLWQDAPKYP